MAGEIQLNSTTMATESSGSITAELDVIRPNTTNGSLTLQGDSSDAGVTGLTIDSSGVVNTTTAKVTNLQATSGQSLTIKDEDGNAAITIGTDNTAASYLSLNFGSSSNKTLNDFEIGTWTPKAGDNSTSLTQNSTAYYIKIGDLVNCFFDVTFPNPNPTLTQAMYGLPFTPKTGTSCGSTPAKHSTSTTWGMVVVGGVSRFLAWENDLTYQNISGQTVIATLTYIAD